MAYDLEEQEQIDALKAWWAQYGTYVVLAVALFVASVFGAQFWRYYQNRQAEQAAALYDKVEAADASHDAKKMADAAAQLAEQFPRSGYASRASLLAARADSWAGDAKGSEARLQWTLDHAASGEIKDAARLRLAGVLLDGKRYDEALKLLDAPHGAGFDGLYADLKGDVLAAGGKAAEAKANYRVALEKLDQSGGYRAMVQMKLDALGG